MVKLALADIKAWLLPDSSTVAQCRQLKLLTRIWALAGVYDVSLPADLDALYGKAIIVSTPDDHPQRLMIPNGSNCHNPMPKTT